MPQARSAHPWCQPGIPCSTCFCRTVVPALLVTVPSLLYVSVSLVSLPCPRPWPAVTEPVSRLIGCFQKEGDANRAVDVSHVTLARERSTCRVPVQSQQQPGQAGEGSEPGPNRQYGQHCEKNCHILRSPKKAKSAPQSLQLMPSSAAAPGMCPLATWLLVTAELGLLPHPSRSQLQGVSANWSFVGKERDSKRGNTRTSGSPKHEGRSLATPLSALGGIEKAKQLQKGQV